MDRKFLAVTVSTREALQTALDSDLQLLFVDHRLRSELGPALEPLMAQGGFRIPGEESPRGTLYTRTADKA